MFDEPGRELAQEPSILMGWKLTAFVFLFAVWAIQLGSMIVGGLLLLYLFYHAWSKRSRKRKDKSEGGGTVRWAAFLGVFLLFLSFVAVAAHGAHSPFFFAGLGVAFLAFGVFPQMIAGMLLRSRDAVLALLKVGRPASSADVATVALTQFPLDHADPKSDPRERLSRFQRVAQTLAELGTAVEFRLSFSSGSGRMTFSVFGRDAQEKLAALLQVARSQLPEFRTEPSSETSPEADVCSVSVEGVPEPAVDPLGPVARFFVESRLEGEYSVTLSPSWVDPVSRWLAKRRQKGLAGDSAVQHHEDDKSKTVTDHPKQVELEESVKRLDRLSARRPVMVAVSISAVDERTVRGAAGVLAGALSGPRGISGLKVSRPKKTTSRFTGPSTLMLPSEAAPYLWIPQFPMGMKVAPSAEFHAPPPTEGEIVLGEVASLSGRTGQQVRLPLDQLSKHVFVTGMTGSGKTTSCFSLLLQLHREGVPFLVIEPVKSEYRSLLAAIPDLQVFTIGDEGTAPFRLNIFEPPPGVKVQAHLENLEAVWNASFVSYAPLPYIIKQVFAEAYRECGWDLARYVRGRPVAFDDVSRQVEEVVRGLGYHDEATRNIEAALKTRLNSLSLGGKGQLFGAEASTPLEAVMSKPTVIELKDIQNDEEKAFVAALILMDVASLAQARGASKHLRHFILVEEAHRLLPNLSTQKGDPEAADPRKRTVEQFGNMLAELRAYGEGLAVVEQIPTKVLSDAVKNTATKVVHRVPAEDDRKAMAGAMNATEEQAAVFAALRPGEAVLSVEGHPVPVRVEVEDAAARLGVQVGGVSDADVRRQMAAFYRGHPLPRERPAGRDERVRRLVEEDEFREEFVRMYRVWLKTGDVGPLRDRLLQASRRMARDEQEVLALARAILRLATAYYLPFDARQRALFPELFMKEVEKSVVRR
jgi:Helicase HerA, central domain